MPEEMDTSQGRMHSEIWWVRLTSGELTEAELAQWRVHLKTCAHCQRKWAALSTLDSFLERAPAVPSLSPAFTIGTVQRIRRRQHLRRYLEYLAGMVIVSGIAVLVLGMLGPTVFSLGRGIGVIVLGRQILIKSIIHTLVGLALSWRSVLPYIAAIVAIVSLVTMPNGLLVALALLWLSGRRRVRVAI